MSCSGIAWNRDDVGPIAGLQRADLILPAEQLRAVEQAGLERGQRRHAVLHHQHELARLRAVGERADIRSDGHRHAGRKLLVKLLARESRAICCSCAACAGEAACSAKYSRIVNVGTAKICFSRIIRMVSSLS